MEIIETAKKNCDASVRAESWKDAHYWMAFLDGAKAQKTQAEEGLTEDALILRLSEMNIPEIRDLAQAAYDFYSYLRKYILSRISDGASGKE